MRPIIASRRPLRVRNNTAKIALSTHFLYGHSGASPEEGEGERRDISVHLKKLFALAIYQVKIKEDNSFEDITTTFEEIWRELGYTGKLNSAELHRKVRGVFDEGEAMHWWVATKVTTRIGSDIQWESMRWLEKVKYTEGSHDVVLRLSQDLAPFVFKLKGNFTQLYVESILALATNHGVGLYEFLRQYARRDLDKNWQIGLPALHDATSVLPNSRHANSWFDFAREVLQPAITDINEGTDLQLEKPDPDIDLRYRPVKKGGKVVAVEFKVVENRNRINSWKRRDQGLVSSKRIPENRRLPAPKAQG